MPGLYNLADGRESSYGRYGGAVAADIILHLRPCWAGTPAAGRGMGLDTPMGFLNLMPVLLVQSLVTAVIAVGLGGLLLFILWRPAFAVIVRNLSRVIMTDPYDENLAELLSSTVRYGAQNIVETNLRAHEGSAPKRPLGSPRRYPHFEGLVFDVAQLRRFPVDPDVKIDLGVTIGPQSSRPLSIDIPIVIAPMAYGLTVSRGVKVAMAKASSMAGTATNTGEGPFLQEERDAAKHLIIQYHRGSWGKEEKVLRQADAIEIQVGQGARAGLGHITKASELDEELRKALGLAKGQDAYVSARIPGVRRIRDVAKLVARLKEIGEGVPVGFKLAAGIYLEEDMAVAVESGADFITVDGGQGATYGAPPIVEDGFGLPTIYALARATRFIRENKLKGKVSLIVSGLIRTPEEVLKALALGADAVYMGTSALFALSHTQSLKAAPFEPPTEVAWHDSPLADDLDIEKAAKTLANFLRACADELSEGVRALGKTDIKDVCREDLVAVNHPYSDIFSLPLGWEPAYRGIGSRTQNID